MGATITKDKGKAFHLARRDRGIKTVYRYRPTLFFALAFAVSWGFWLVGAWAGTQEALKAYAPLFSLAGLIGPIGATLYLVFSSENTALKCDFKCRLLDVRRI